MKAVRSSRQLAAEKKQCPICLEDFFEAPTGRDCVAPVQMGCQHIFCRECIEAHLSSQIKCPLPWCEARLPLQPDDCYLCAYWERNKADSLVVTVRAKEMTTSIKDALTQLTAEDELFNLSKKEKSRLMMHVRETLTRYERQFHSGIGLAELLDPFLLAVDQTRARAYYGAKLQAPAPNPSMFPRREHDPDDYPRGQEPWVAAFFRQWALEYEQENGEVKEGWGVAAKSEDGSDWSWEWPYKRILAHKTEVNGKIRYLVKWVGNRWPDSWVSREELGDAARRVYDEAHGITHEID